MTRIEKTVFISYRRTNLPWALFVYQNLTMHGYDVFFDYQSIDSGNFESVILDNIKARAHFIVILTPSALENCNKPSDWLRREIETAMDENRNIVPLMVENFDFGSTYAKEALTGKLTGLVNYNGLPVPNAYALEAMERLRERYLNKVVSNLPTQILQADAQKITETQKSAANKATPVQAEQLSAQVWFERGYVYAVEAKNFDEAIRCFSESIRLEPNSYTAFHNRGRALMDKGDFNSAIADFGEAIQINPNLPNAWANRGFAIIESGGDIEQALNDLNEATKLDPKDYISYNNLGRIYHKKEELEKAFDKYTLSIQNSTDYHYPFNNRGDVRYKKGDVGGAILDYNEAIQIKPDDFDSYVRRSIAYAKKGDLDNALSDINEAIRLKPDDADNYINRGNIMLKTGDLMGAIIDFNEAIHLKPNSTAAYSNRAIAFVGSEEYSRAIEDFQRYLDLGGGIQYGNQENIEAAIKDLKKKIK